MHTFHYVTVLNMFKLTIKPYMLSFIYTFYYLIIPGPIVIQFIYIIYKTFVSYTVFYVLY